MFSETRYLYFFKSYINLRMGIIFFGTPRIVEITLSMYNIFNNIAYSYAISTLQIKEPVPDRNFLICIEINS